MVPISWSGNVLFYITVDAFGRRGQTAPLARRCLRPLAKAQRDYHILLISLMNGEGKGD